MTATISALVSRICQALGAAGSVSDVVVPPRKRMCARPLDGAVMQSVGLVKSHLEFLLDGQRDLQGQGRDALEQHAADRVIEPAAWDALTNRFAPRNPSPLTEVRGPHGPLAVVIAHR